jgi:membrane-associated protein
MMEAIKWVLDLDKTLTDLTQKLGPWAYGLLIAVIFFETAVVIFPFLPGDSLLIPVGLFCRKGMLNLWVVLFTLPPAAIAGDYINFHIGKFLGPKLFTDTSKGIFKKSNLEETREFFEKHGTKAIILGRFVPVVRALAPFVAGMEGMPREKFVKVSVVAAFFWVWTCVFIGYVFGAIPWVQEHFEHALILLFAILGAVIVIERLLHKRKRKLHAAQVAKAAQSGTTHE